MFTTIAAMLSTSALGLGWTKASNQWERTALIAVLLPTACVSTLALIVLLGWRMVSLWLVKATPAEYDDDTMAHIIGCRLDPEKGVVMDLLWNTERCSAVVNPCYWQFLPSDAISSPDGNESLVIGSKLSKIAPGKEPPSLVCISDGSRIVGMGSRVSYRGNSYLLTAAHVWMGKAEKLFLVKGALQVEVEVAKFPPKLGCLDAAADFVLVEIPSPCWARLRVKSSQLGGMDRPKLVTVFGGKNPQGLISSVGMANVGPFSHQIIHTATTVEGWSGTPLYSKGSIVGIHLGRRTLGKENRGVNVDLLLGIEDESDYSEGGNFTEIEREAAFDRDYDFVEIRMIGSGKIAVGHGEWFRSDPDAFEKKKKAKGEVMWGDIESDDEFYNTMEAPEDHLNYERAASQKRSPPSSLTEAMTGAPPVVTAASPQVVPAKECRCGELASRLADLENLVAKLTSQGLTQLLVGSQSSTALHGPTEEQPLKTPLSSSKPVGSGQRQRRKASSKPVEPSTQSTQSQIQESVSKGKPGENSRSRRRRRRSATQKSTATPLQASPSHD